MRCISVLALIWANSDRKYHLHHPWLVVREAIVSVSALNIHYILCVYVCSKPNPETFYLCNKCHNFRMLRTLFRFAPYFIFLPGFLSDAI